MAGFDHHASDSEKVTETVNVRSTRFGWGLFVVYAVLYGAFVLFNAFSPEMMEKTPLGGVNLAILFGLGIIAAAFLLALVYDWICRLLAEPSTKEGEGRA
jgi:uncharacterized membrane protein (DUF485 family)